MQPFKINMLKPVFLVVFFLSILAGLSISCSKEKKDKEADRDTLALNYSIRTQWVHDPTAFTQGLVIHEGKLYESTGQKQSWIGIVDINTGKPDKKVVLDDAYFGEGITILNNKVYQLTW